MKWMDRLRGKTVGLDTAPLIYFIEKTPEFYSRVRPFFLAMQRGDFEVVTSTVTVTEVMVKPFRLGDAALVKTYRDILHRTAHLRIVPFTDDIAEIAAHLRADHKIQTPDAIQIATAMSVNADFFLTNDAELPALPRPAVLVLKDTE
jgi:predicted nucleic acid-binding protein